ncbi:hypothetical protein BSK49_03820 [Paenibacillus odorifer]|uniref:hypothetical protein n=1 Tax=Paenibacillus odorifer TaxID=189426 RepID=UPI00096C2A20|nr:hypothetical protein [Paenibacillus odorifer]OMD92415.1 hypothetical protein BSK49_03820 [Paenibacillus odorifer]
MKKFVSGVIVGALLFGGASVFADSASLIGQKVQGLFTVEKNGSKVADALVINGSAYAPVRAVAEATGTKLTVEGKKIIMGETTTVTVTPNKNAELKAEYDKTLADITRLENGIQDIEKNVIPGLKESAEILSTNGKIGERAKETLAQYEAQLQKDKTELAFLQEKLAQLKTQLGE